ncbi:high mobility group box protein, partial [Gigaspora rosea]
ENPPRPMNPFIIYRTKKAKEIYAKNPSITTGELSKKIGEMWRNEPQGEKSKYKKIAEKAKQQHMEKYPDYKY